MYRGRVPLGIHLPLSVRTLDASRRPVAPTTCPVLDVYSSAGTKVVSKLIPIEDAGAVTGFFNYRLFISPAFDVGKYTAVYHWNDGSHAGAEVDVFEVIGGGNNEGTVISMREFVRPHARFVVHQLDSGKLKRGRNPRL